METAVADPIAVSEIPIADPTAPKTAATAGAAMPPVSASAGTQTIGLVSARASGRTGRRELASATKDSCATNLRCPLVVERLVVRTLHDIAGRLML